MNVLQLDVLSPFSNGAAVNTRRKNRQGGKYFESMSPKYPCDSYSVHSFSKQINGKTVFGHRAIVQDGRKMFSVLEPFGPGGCDRKAKGTVLDSAKQRNCVIAVNAGFFKRKTGECHGNIISDGIIVNKFKGARSASFGVKKDGSIVVGYLSHENIDDTVENPFTQLVSGIGWILRNGESYVEESLKHEQCNLDNLSDFFQVKSARTFLGHDSNGYIHLVLIDGKTRERGINLYEAPIYLKSLGIINAINLDGGGASTFVVNDAVVNYPSNVCKIDEEEILCAMNVSTILCVHHPYSCESYHNCSHHGICQRGNCICEYGWSGNHCEQHEPDHSLSYCCWRNYYLVIVLTTIIGFLVIVNIYICNLYLLYRFRFKYLLNPPKRDRLRHHLRVADVLSSTNEEYE